MRFPRLACNARRSYNFNFVPTPTKILRDFFGSYAKARTMKIQPANRIDRLPPYILGRLKNMIYERRKAGADVIELGVPFSDPMADGVTLQQTSAAALAAGATLTDLLDRLGDAAIDTPLVLMSYLNPLLALGPELVPRLVAAGISGLVVPDLPAEECDGLDHALAAHGLALIQLVAPTTPLNRARELAARSRGFVYVVTGLGVTGGDAAFTADLEARMAALREAATAPVLAGFGIRRAEQLRALLRRDFFLPRRFSEAIVVVF